VKHNHIVTMTHAQFHLQRIKHKLMDVNVGINRPAVTCRILNQVNKIPPQYLV